MRKFESGRFRTDVLVFTQIDDEEHRGSTKALEEIGCTRHPRTEFGEASMCRLRNYTPLKFRDWTADPVARDLKGYKYGESTQIVAEYPDDAYVLASHVLYAYGELSLERNFVR